MLISKGTSVGAGTVITNSVIGRNCVIGKKKIVVSWGLHEKGTPLFENIILRWKRFGGKEER